MLKTTPTRRKGRTSAGLVSGARPPYTGWRSVFWSNSVPFKTQRLGAGLQCLTLSFFSFLLPSLKDVLRHGMETAVRFKMRRNKNTMLCCISRCSSHSALHLPTSILTAPGMQPVMALAKMEEMALENIEKEHGKDAELHSLWPGQVDNSTAAVLLSQPLLVHGKQVCGETLEGHSAFSGCFSSREWTPVPRKCSGICLLSELVKNYR